MPRDDRKIDALLPRSVRLSVRRGLAGRGGRGEVPRLRRSCSSSGSSSGFSSDAAGRLIPHPGEQEVLSAVRELRAAGLSLRAIVAELGARGLVV